MCTARNICVKEAEVRNLTSWYNSLACSEYPFSSLILCLVFVGSVHWFPQTVLRITCSMSARILGSVPKNKTWWD